MTKHSLPADIERTLCITPEVSGLSFGTAHASAVQDCHVVDIHYGIGSESRSLKIGIDAHSGLHCIVDCQVVG